jgi:hypothetical protein
MDCCECNLESMIANMLTENTGIHMMDSGMGSGRAWQQHQLKMGESSPQDYLSAAPFVRWDEFSGIKVSTYHHFTDTLKSTEHSRALDEEFHAFASHNAWLEDMESWVQTLIDSDRVEKSDVHGAENTYNSSEPVTQHFQYVSFELDDETYHIVQTHNGADIRGGYSTPHVFAATGEVWALGDTGEGVSLYCTNEGCVDDYGQRHAWDHRQEGCVFEDENGDELGDTATEAGDRVWLKIELREHQREGTTVDHTPVSEFLELSVFGLAISKGRRNVDTAGQCVEMAAEIDRPAKGWTTAELRELRDLWQRWHLNGMQAHCAHMTVNPGGYDVNKDLQCPQSG